MKRIAIVIALMMLAMIATGCLADGNRVELGDTGTYFTIDTKYEIITNKNKGEYTQNIQALFTHEKEVMAYAEDHGVIVIVFDQGKNLQALDFLNKEIEDLPYFYDKMINLEEAAAKYGNYELSIYDNGKVKWKVVCFRDVNIWMYGTVYGQKMVMVTFKMVASDTNETESIIDTFEFGSPSFWSRLKSLAGRISAFGRSILGGYGVYVVWTAIIGVVFFFISMIFGIVASAVKKSEKR